MSFEAAKCPSCGANIQVPTDTEQANCMYCGRQIFVKEAIQKHKVELSGNVTVDANIESMLKSAEGFLRLKKWKEAEKLYTKIIDLDSTDYRGWWGMFLVKTHNLKWYSTINSSMDLSDATAAIEMAPEGTKEKLIKALSDYESNYKAYKLTIKRKRQYTGAACKVKVCINGGHVCSLKSGQTYDLDAPANIYDIDFDFGGTNSNIVFEMDQDVFINLRVGLAWGNLIVESQGIPDEQY